MINGGMKFFYNNYALYRDGATATATSNDEAAIYTLDVNRYTQWESVGSDDSVTETLTINLPRARLINRLFLIKMNFKEFSVKYYNGASYVDFTDVISVNGVAKSGINETTCSWESSYYEFAEVSTTSIQITVLKSQVEDAEKYLNQFIATYEIGTFEGFPRITPSSERNETKAKTLGRKYVVQKTYDTTDIDINFKSHPYENDLQIIDALFESEEAFLAWPCGGRTGAAYFRMNQRNWRLEDIYSMQTVGSLKNEWEKGVYILGFNKTLKLVEHV